MLRQCTFELLTWNDWSCAQQRRAEPLGCVSFMGGGQNAGNRQAAVTCEPSRTPNNRASASPSNTMAAGVVLSENAQGGEGRHRSRVYGKQHHGDLT